MPNLAIIPISEAHIAAYHAALDKIAKEGIHLGYYAAPAVEVLQQRVMKNIAHSLPHYIALCNGSIVGWCEITSMNLPIFSHSGSLEMGVAAEYRGLRIGQELLRLTLLQAKNIGLKRIILSVREPNQAALKLYLKFGFTIEGLHIDAVNYADRFENLISMALLF